MIAGATGEYAFTWKPFFYKHGDSKEKGEATFKNSRVSAIACFIQVVLKPSTIELAFEYCIRRFGIIVLLIFMR